MNLYPHQHEQLEAVRDELRKGRKRVLLQAATGVGKTVMAASAILSAANKQKRILFVVHRIELVDQSFKEFTAWHLDPGVIASGWPMSRGKQVQIAMVQTLVRKLDLFEQFDLIILDEAHHAPAGTWKKVFEYYRSSVVIGLSATPERLDGTGLGGYFDSLVPGKSVSWLIENKFLSPYKLFRPETVPQQDFRLRSGEFVQSEVTAVMDTPTVTGDAVSHYLQHSAGQRCIVFASSIQASLHVVQAYRERGIPAEHVDGETEKDVRKQRMQDFSDGKLLVMSNVGLFSEGVNVPTVQTVQLLAPTASLSKYLQSVGRALRYVPGKTAVILDHVGNVFRHGKPDIDREWSLDGRKKRPRSGGGPMKECLNCYAGNPISAKECWTCGHKFPVKESEGIQQVDGELVMDQPRSYHEEMVQDMMREAKTMNDWHSIAKVLGFKPGWAYHRFQEAQRNGKARKR